MGDERSFKPNTLSFEEAYRAHSWAPLVELVLTTADRLDHAEALTPRLRRMAASMVAWVPLLAMSTLVYALT